MVEERKSADPDEPVVELVPDMVISTPSNVYPYAFQNFKYSVLQPNNRLNTIDEVNSTYSEHDISRFSKPLLTPKSVNQAKSQIKP